MKKFNMGIDLGGTKVLCALVDEKTNKIEFEVKKKTKKIKGNKNVIQKIYEAIDELLKISGVNKNQINSIGVAAAGQIDRKNGILLYSCNLECVNLNIKELLECKYNIKTTVGNDVEVSAIAEMMLGAGKDYNNMVCIFIGTGVGSSIIIDRKLVHGATGTAGELGHTVVQPDGRICSCGESGCLEAYASRTAIEARIDGMIKKGKYSIISDICDTQNISTKHLKEALDGHDSVVTECIGEAVKYLSSGIANIINFLNPELIILGGGIIQGIDEFYLKTVRSSKNKALLIASGKTEFKKAELGDYSGVIGASILEKYYNAV